MQPLALELDRELDHLCDRLPEPFRGWLRDLLRASAWRRVPAGLALIVGGVLSFLPVLGIWMRPLGLVLVAKDVPILHGPSARALAWIRRRFPSRRKP